MVWPLVLNPPRECPIAWLSPDFFGTGAVLVSAHDGAVDHRVFVVGIGCEMLEDPLPDSGFSLAAEAQMDILPVAEAFRKVTSRDAGSIPVQHSLNEQPIFRRGYPDTPARPGNMSLIRSHGSSRSP
jgi:hypothetical protein